MNEETFQLGEDFAHKLDAEDPLAKFLDRFYFPKISKTNNNKKRQIDAHHRILSQSAIKEWQLNHELEYMQMLSRFYSPSGFRPLAMETFAPVLSDCVNHFYKDFTNGAGDINVVGKASLASKRIVDKIDIHVSEDGKRRTFPGAWSLGEGGPIDLSLNCGIMRLASEQAAKEFKLFWLDEVLISISSKWIGSIITTLRQKLLRPGVSILLTSNQELPRKMFDQKWTIVMENSRSRIERN